MHNVLNLLTQSWRFLHPPAPSYLQSPWHPKVMWSGSIKTHLILLHALTVINQGHVREEDGRRFMEMALYELITSSQSKCQQSRKTLSSDLVRLFTKTNLHWAHDHCQSFFHLLENTLQAFTRYFCFSFKISCLLKPPWNVNILWSCVDFGNLTASIHRM